MHAYIQTYTYTYIHIHTHIYIYIHTYTYIHIQSHKYTYTHTYIYIYIHMMMHVHIWVRSNPRPDTLCLAFLLESGQGMQVSPFFYLLDIFANSKQGNEILTSLNIRKYKTHMIWPNRCFGNLKKENKILISPRSQEKTYCSELLHVTGKKGNKTLISLNIRKEKTKND